MKRFVDLYTNMFSGIVEKMGVLKKIESKQGKVYFTISAGKFLSGIHIGGSVACDGVCLTVIKLAGGYFKVELMPETLWLTKFKESKTGDLINLEKSLRVGDRISGHFVMGHVDAVGEVIKAIKQGADASLTIRVPKKIIQYLAYKGSISVNGVSLTIAASTTSLRTAAKDWFKVCLIGHTLKITNLGKLKMGDKVNIEVDTIARYLASLFKKRRPK